MVKDDVNHTRWLAVIILALVSLAALTVGCISVADKVCGDRAYRSYTNNPDRNERYSVVYGEGNIRVFMPGGTEVPVEISDVAHAYIRSHSATADDLRFVTIGDDTLILNTKVVPETKSSLDYPITKTHKDYNALLRWSPQRNTYHATEKETSTNSSSYWRYIAESDGWAKWVSARVGANWCILAQGVNGCPQTTIRWGSR